MRNIKKQFGADYDPNLNQLLQEQINTGEPVNQLITPGTDTDPMNIYTFGGGRGDGPVTPVGNGPDSPPLPSGTQNLLDLINSNSSQSVLDLLLQLGNGNFEGNDQQWALWQSLLDYKKYLEERQYNRGLQLEQRGYDFSRLLEQRQYDSPNAQLQRLMETGLSRAAALNFMSAQSSGSGASGSASVPYASGTPQNQLGLSPSESDLNRVNRDMSILGGVVNTLSGIAGLVVGGFNIKNMILQNALNANALVASDKQKQAYNDVGSFVKALYAVNPVTGKRYTELAESASMSAEAVLRYAQGVTKEQNPVLYDFMRSPQAQSFAQNPYAWQLYDSSFAQHSDSRRKAMENDALIQSELLQCSQEMASVNLRKNQAELMQFLDQYEDFKELRPYIKFQNLQEIQDKIDLLAAARTPEQLAYRLSTLQDSNASLAFIAMINKMQQSNMFDLLQQNPLLDDLMTMSAVFDKIGLTGEAGQILRGLFYYKRYQHNLDDGNNILIPEGAEDVQMWYDRIPPYRLVKSVYHAVSGVANAIYNKFGDILDDINDFQRDFGNFLKTADLR